MFDIHQTVCDQYGELDEKRSAAYIDGLMAEFVNSPEAKPLLDQNVDLGWAGMMMEFGLDHLGYTPAEMSRRDFEEVVFELIPRKVSTEPESAAEMVTVWRAFWQFLQRQYALPNARQLLASLDDKATPKLRAALANPTNWGMAKSFMMQGLEAGYDMGTQEGMDAFLLEYNRRLLEGRLQGLGPVGMPPLPFDEGLLPFDEELPLLPEPPGTPHKSREQRRKERKRQRQARKRHRRK